MSTTQQGQSFGGYGFHESLKKATADKYTSVWPMWDDRWLDQTQKPNLGILVAGNDISATWSTDADVQWAIKDFRDRWGGWFGDIHIYDVVPTPWRHHNAEEEE